MNHVNKLEKEEFWNHRFPRLICLSAYWLILTMAIMLVCELFFATESIEGRVERLQSNHQTRLFGEMGDSTISIAREDQGVVEYKIPSSVYEEVTRGMAVRLKVGEYSGVAFQLEEVGSSDNYSWTWFPVWFWVEIFIASLVFLTGWYKEDAFFIVGFVFLAGAWGTFFTWF